DLPPNLCLIFKGLAHFSFQNVVIPGTSATGETFPLHKHTAGRIAGSALHFVSVLKTHNHRHEYRTAWAPEAFPDYCCGHTTHAAGFFQDKYNPLANSRHK